MIFRPQTAKILEKSRAARAEDGQICHRNRESAAAHAAGAENEDDAKITDSKSDFLTRKWLKKTPKNLKIG